MNAALQLDPVANLRDTVVRAATETAGTEPGPRLTFERPPSAELGDYSTNAALLLAPRVGGSGREVGERLADALRTELSDVVDRIEIAGPGFVNLFLSDRWYRAAVGAILAADPAKAAPPKDERMLVEFVSANPTGPVTVAGARGAAFGDSLARILDHCGYGVDREYYVNDTGAQVRLFAASVAAGMRGDDPPQDGYTGAYVGELATELRDLGLEPEVNEKLERAAIDAMTERVESTLERFRVRFDRWFSERSLHESAALDGAIEELRRGGHVYESEGAVWFRTSALGDDKDRVLIRSDGEPTYFATDIAYHRDKIERGYDQLITPLGADHHGYVARMKAAMVAFGATADHYEAPILQLVNVVEGGQRARMSKRRGEFVALEELIEDIGVDAARFFMVQRSSDTAIDLDLDLARSTSQDNPVYYVQYAHARIAGILGKADAEGRPLDLERALADAADVPCEPAERELVRRLLDFRGEVSTAGDRRAPHRLTAYSAAIAADFHAFYRDCRVVGAEPPVEAARLALCLAAKGTIATTLGLLGVVAPDQM